MARLTCFKGIRAVFLVVLFVCPSQTRAQVLVGLNESLAALESAAQGDTSYLFRRFSAPDSPLDFTGHIGLASFDYTIAPNSTYNGSPITMNGVGTLVGPRTWDVVTMGALGADTWTATTEVTFAAGGGPVDNETSNGQQGDWDWHRTVAWFEDPLDLGRQMSFGVTIFTFQGQIVRFVNELDERRVLLEAINFNASLVDFSFMAGSFSTVTGNGAFRVTAVPEPGALGMLMCASLVAGLVLLRGRASRPFDKSAH